MNFVDSLGLKKEGLLKKIWRNKSLLVGLASVFACTLAVAVCGTAGLISLGVSLFDSAERNFSNIRKGQYGQFFKEAAISAAFSRIPVARFAKTAGSFFNEAGIRSTINLYGGLYSVGAEQPGTYLAM